MDRSLRSDQVKCSSEYEGKVYTYTAVAVSPEHRYHVHCTVLLYLWSREARLERCGDGNAVKLGVAHTLAFLHKCKIYL